MPTILGANQLDTGYEISNSLRFEGSGAIGLARFGNNSRNGNTFTISAWIKRVKLGANTVLFNSKVEDSGVNSFIIMFESDDKISVGGQPASGSGAGGHRTVIKTNAVFRDPSAWYHMVYRQDTTQSTAANRHILYINGEATNNGTYAALDQNVAFAYFYNAGSYPFAIANDERDNSYGSFYIAEHHYTDGVSNGPDAFGETNDNGVWIPKKYTGSHGSYGHYLKFEQSGGGSGTTSIGGHDYTTGSSSTIGADSSGNDNHFHIQGYDTYDNTTDTPTNNFNTLNPLANAMGGTLTEGNLKCVGVNAVDRHVFGTFGLTGGKWYFEIKTTDRNARGSVWVSDTDHEAVIGTNYAGVSMHSGATPTSGTSNSNLDQAPTDGDIVCYAVDLDNGQVWFSRNANIDTSGTANVTGLATSGLDRDYRISQRETGNPASTFEHNYGNAPYAISSSNSDANGYGNFEYAVPSGYYALNTKNLAEFG